MRPSRPAPSFARGSRLTAAARAERKGPDGEEGPPPRPGSAGYVNHITLRTHWAHMDRAPSTTWGDLEKQVYGGPHHSVSVYDKM